jgi:hypothetical protein
MKTKASTRVCVTFSPYVKEKLELMSDYFCCSQAEVVRIALLKLWEAEQ